MFLAAGITSMCLAALYILVVKVRAKTFERFCNLTLVNAIPYLLKMLISNNAILLRSLTDFKLFKTVASFHERGANVQHYIMDACKLIYINPCMK